MNTKTTVISQEQLDHQLTLCHTVSELWRSRGITPSAYKKKYRKKPAEDLQ